MIESTLTGKWGWGTGEGQYSLMQCVMFPGRRMGYTVPLMRLYEHEKDLDRGRFEFFVIQPQEHIVPLRVSRDCDMPWPILSEMWINWIAEQTGEPWSLHLDMANVHEGIFYFSFANLTTATMFKMVMG